MDLQTLIERRRSQGGRRLSLQDLADAAGVSKQTFAGHAKPRPSMNRRLPSANTVQAMAKALNVDTTAIVLAAGETMGVIPANRARPPLLDLLPPWETLEKLTPEDIDTVVRLVTLLADRHGGDRVPRGTRRAPAATPTRPRLAVGEPAGDPPGVPPGVLDPVGVR